jgi:hypothetical protein
MPEGLGNITSLSVHLNQMEFKSASQIPSSGTWQDVADNCNIILWAKFSVIIIHTSCQIIK